MRDYREILGRFIQKDAKLEEVIFDLDLVFAELCRNYDVKNFHGYDTYQFDELVNDVNRLLDRCLVYRREYNEAIAELARQQLEDELLDKQNDLSEAIEEARWEEDVKAVERDAFTRMGQADIERGFREYASVQSEVAEEAVRGRTERSEKIHQRWTATRLYQTESRELRGQPGHPLNLTDRAARILRLMKEDFQEALEKADSAADGSKLVRLFFGAAYRTEPADKAMPWKPLDDFVSWARQSAVEVDKLRHRESIEERVVSLTELGKKQVTPDTPIPFSMTEGNDVIELVDAIAFSLKIATLTKDGKDIDQNRISAAVTLDVGEKLSVMRPSRSRPNRLIFSDVGIRSAGFGAKFLVGRQIRNLPITTGMTVQVSKVMLDNEVDPHFTQQMKDVFMHVRTRAYSIKRVKPAGGRDGDNRDGDGGKDEGKG